MAKVIYNVVTHGVSGKVGDLLQFRQRNGKTIIAKIAARSKTLTAKEQAVRDKFLLASAYAKAAFRNPAKRAIYEVNAAGDISAYNLAFKDFFTPPVIQSINTENYTGTVGSSILVMATDDTKVEQVLVRILDSTGDVVEEGNAVQQGEQDEWIYSSAISNNNVAGGKVIVEVSDLPGNSTTQEVLLS